jgi:hypothetical protein
MAGLRRTSIAWAALIALSTAGCAVARRDFIQLNAGTSYPERPMDAPVVLSVGDLDRPYEELGVIHVSGVIRHGYERLNERMRARARQVGADAVVFVHYGTENVMSIIPFFVAIPYDVLTAGGLAVRSLDEADLRAGQPQKGAPPGQRR